MEFKERDVQFPNRRKIRKIEELENGTIIADIESDEIIEGVVTEQGTPITAAALNDIIKNLESKADRDLLNATFKVQKQLYQHSIHIWTAGYAMFSTTIVSTSSTPFTYQSLMNELIKMGHTSVNNCYACSGGFIGTSFPASAIFGGCWAADGAIQCRASHNGGLMAYSLGTSVTQIQTSVKEL